MNEFEELKQESYSLGQRTALIKIMRIILKSRKADLNDKFIIESVIEVCTEISENPEKLAVSLTEKEIGLNE